MRAKSMVLLIYAPALLRKRNLLSHHAVLCVLFVLHTVKGTFPVNYSNTLQDKTKTPPGAPGGQPVGGTHFWENFFSSPETKRKIIFIYLQ